MLLQGPDEEREQGFLSTVCRDAAAARLGVHHLARSSVDHPVIDARPGATVRRLPTALQGAAQLLHKARLRLAKPHCAGLTSDEVHRHSLAKRESVLASPLLR